MKIKSKSLLSLGYWFSSRSLGLGVHPYITMREIMREKFLRPLVLLPAVIGGLSWIVAIMVGRLGLGWGLKTATWTIPLGRILVFSWVWLGMFLGIWQIVLGYLYWRFKQIEK